MVTPGKIVIGLVLVSLALFTAGCAGTASGTKSSAFSGDGSVSVTDFSLSKADALVVIRYPAIIHADAEEPYFHAFSINAIGGEVPPANRTKRVTTRIAQSVLAKSNYYVMSFYRELQRVLPEHTVLLSPHIVMWDAERGVYSRPILATEQIPSVLTIDFNVYSFPDPRKMMDSPPLTFGDIVTPMFTIHANHWLRPPTNGLLLSSEALVEAAEAGLPIVGPFPVPVRMVQIEHKCPLRIRSGVLHHLQVPVRVPGDENRLFPNKFIDPHRLASLVVDEIQLGQLADHRIPVVIVKLCFDAAAHHLFGRDAVDRFGPGSHELDAPAGNGMWTHAPAGSRTSCSCEDHASLE